MGIETLNYSVSRGQARAQHRGDKNVTSLKGLKVLATEKFTTNTMTLCSPERESLIEVKVYLRNIFFYIYHALQIRYCDLKL